ncbi:hypothetical protein [Roseateles saccharophilus]|uniref:hypothetical protein n=1 Tax=Roseateles saccharophilus TaxID=304 RepID=UPI002407A870|nr:hypothetical protein [Roseateles saccharophilus]
MQAELHQHLANDLEDQFEQQFKQDFQIGLRRGFMKPRSLSPKPGYFGCSLP